ncbi:uncharacterized protein [Medicago truncatula]|uniref:uncharacterized protein n=1 Tax=Medicago truncatula TaxID=3880 RepID=UPI0000D5D3E7|nr:uncharacterized protein LOC112421705 [Medicago truncatula]XP_039691198.1 uncharacterized protein LOC120580930 [Medicago truncatula]
MLTKARKKGRPKWISVDAWTGLETYWKTNPNFLKSSNQNKANRASTKGGAVHTSGRKAHIDVALELSNNLQRDLDPDELFLYTHKRKTGEWVDSRSKATYESFKKKVSTVQAQIDETTGDGVQEVDGGTKLRLWTESAGGRTRGRVYGTADLSVNLRRGCTSFTQKSRDHHGSMYEMSLEAERAARVRAEEKAAIAEKKADDALAQSQMAIDLNKQMMIEIAEFKKFVMERDRRSGNGSCSATQPLSHPHYDDNLDDHSLHSDS